MRKKSRKKWGSNLDKNKIDKKIIIIIIKKLKNLEKIMIDFEKKLFWKIQWGDSWSIKSHWGFYSGPQINQEE